ncbi:MAG: hypothetical protein M0008_12865 [Actinomycetota bacterium]|nr:hypothetical protein [Actinomycetota bacterium]
MSSLSETTLMAVRERVQASRVDQRLPPVVEDPQVLDMVATVLDYAAATKMAA